MGWGGVEEKREKGREAERVEGREGRGESRERKEKKGEERKREEGRRGERWRLGMAGWGSGLQSVTPLVQILASPITI